VRTHRFWVAVVAYSTLSGVGAGLDETSALGMISQLSGQVFIERGSSRTAAKLAELLFPGDRITTAAGKASFLFCPSSSVFSIPERATVELGANGVKTIKGAAPAKEPAKCLLPRIALGSESLERFGGLRARNEVPMALYLGGAITTERPAFQWQAVEGAQSYRLTLRDAGRDEPVWQTSIETTGADFPESLPPLEKTGYEWEVLAMAGRTTLARGMAAFVVKPMPGLPGAPANSAERLLLAIELENEGYYAQAALHYRELRKADPGDERLTRHLAWLYWNAGLIVAANDELRRLAGQPRK